MSFQNVASIVTAMIEIVFFGALYLGWPSLEYVLEKEGFFSNLCKNESAIFEGYENTTSPGTIFEPLTCKESRSSYNLVFTVSNFFAYASSFPLGFILDHFGSWIFRSLLAILFTLGAVLLAVATPETSILLYPSLALLSLSGNALAISNLQVANLAKSFRGLILTFSNGLLTSCVLVFFLVKIGYESETELSQMLFIFPLMTVFLWFRTFVLMPRKFIPFELPETGFEYGYKEWKWCKAKSNLQQFRPVSQVAIEPNNQSPDTCDECSEKKKNENDEETLPATTSFLDCLKRPLFWTNVFHFCVVTFRIGVVYGILQQWLKGFADENAISKLTDDFGFMLLFAALIAPINGIIFDALVKSLTKKTKSAKVANLRATIISMLATSMFSILLSFTMVIFNPYGTFVFLLLARSFAFGGNATFITVNFPAEHIGKLMGLTYIIAGTVSLIQYPLFTFAFAEDPTFYYINICILIVSAITIVHPILIFLETKTRVIVKENMLTDEA